MKLHYPFQFLLLAMIILSSCSGIASSATPQPTRADPATQSLITTSTESSLTQTASAPIPTVNAGVMEPQAGSMIILADGSGFYLENISTGEGRFLTPEDARNIQSISTWEGNGCTLIVDLGGDIVEIDLHGNIIRTIFQDHMIHAQDGANSYATISPDSSWVYYHVGTGAVEIGPDIQASRYEFEDIETMSVDGLQGPYRISKRGGAFQASWSPDGQHLAYSDYDESGIHQLFVNTRVGTDKRQMTDFTTPVEIIKILWSPDMAMIALLVDQTGDQAADATVVIDLKGASPARVFTNLRAQWWRDANTLIALQRVRREQRYRNLVKLDYISARITPLIYGECSHINAFGNPAVIGCLTAQGQFKAVDSTTYSVEYYPNYDPRLVDLRYWIAAPESFPREAGCGNIP